MADGDGLPDVLDISGNGKGVALNVFPEDVPDGFSNIMLLQSVAELQEVTGIHGRFCYLSNGLKSGFFKFNAANLSLFVTNDPLQGVIIPPASDPTGAHGAWVRMYDDMANVLWWGAVGNGIAVDAPAFLAARDFLKFTAVNVSSNGFYKVSSGLYVPIGHYFMASTALDISHTFRMLGGGPVGQNNFTGGVRMRWNDNCDGIRTQRYNTSGENVIDGPHFGGDCFVLENFWLDGGYAGVESESHGFHPKARFKLLNCMITNFGGSGIYSNADSGGDGASQGNTNCSRIDTVVVIGCRDGLEVTGGDSNAWTIIDLDTTGNRRWGRNDTSFLCMTYEGGHASDNGFDATNPTIAVQGGNRYGIIDGQEIGARTNAPSGTTADNTWWYYISGGGTNPPLNINNWANGTLYRAGGAGRYNNANSDKHVIGFYTEGGQGFVQATYPATIIGGTILGKIRGTGLWIRNYNGALRTEKALFGADAGNLYSIDTGGIAFGNATALPLGAALRFNIRNHVAWGYANSDQYTLEAFEITTPGTLASMDPHYMWFPRGCYVGPAGSTYKIFEGAQPAAITDASTAVAAPTKAEFDALVGKFNTALAALRTQGVIHT